MSLLKSSESFNLNFATVFFLVSDILHVLRPQSLLAACVAI